ncbi:hypothetical protein VTO73DRAFT_14932 [Trametes versicolor]
MHAPSLVIPDRIHSFVLFLPRHLLRALTLFAFVSLQLIPCELSSRHVYCLIDTHTSHAPLPLPFPFLPRYPPAYLHKHIPDAEPCPRPSCPAPARRRRRRAPSS